ncbi:uncharacterized protein LDX57_003303 [Aspergillus melleus]|uniref:uncharacterized protein n=1 Tax=Aspergillus melleus TaxID=138277 RepID=UPI001E8DC054|nr:uncharacterized protein LDX57_003303 [Aspergillus melleus]KAH8425552.1 hypothetical protein LDX57_003303 [Aspergillus melleus]
MKIAIDRGRVGALRGFLEAGMSPSLMTPNRLPLLSEALMYQRVDAAKLLLEYGADPCGGCWYWCTTPLHYAVRYTGPSNCMIEPLLNAGAKAEGIELWRWLFDHQNPAKHLEQALANGSNFKRIRTDYGDLSVLYALSASNVDLLTVCLGDMILEKWPELLNSCDDRYGTVLKYVLASPIEPRNAIYFLDRGIDLRGGELQDAIDLRRGHEIHGWKANPARIRETDSIRRTIIVKLLAHPQVDLNTASMSYSGKVEKPLIAAFVRADIETARMILEHPAFQPDAEDICVMTDKLSRERPNGANYERQIQGEVLKMTARRLAMNF